MLRLTDVNDDVIAIAAETVVQVLDQPRGQTMLVFGNGSTLQVKESVEQVTAQIEKERSK
jgi:uncharacterized protein YlzI (FlbEa/FlbD family)